MSSFVYNKAKSAILKGEINLLTDTIKVALVGSGYTADKDADEFFDDISNEVSGTGYTAGGKVLSNKGITVEDANDLASFDADDPTWTVSTVTARAAVLYKDTGLASTSPLIAYIDFGQDFSKAGADFTIQWDSAGIFYLGES
ncbi:MAG: hypothetical protein HON98_02585 [Chloroflexi bacterium]|jgi:hypothetical protein|nr:hypothetical protein [Chloroflexota bacterium]MBT3668729.1 hypothetical protein [Chloroflexota bacterium]MBT4002784.1 hypothetical protein [Chloroflexota bacterium]MBT4305430.1 hypothetical protein [Chloroflexota bacterium]MBT4533041.1 hypothetical protein [Chloroflexota bacterium]